MRIDNYTATAYIKKGEGSIQKVELDFFANQEHPVPTLFLPGAAHDMCIHGQYTSCKVTLHTCSIWSNLGFNILLKDTAGARDQTTDLPITRL